jgi:manganese/zinc/iron transport system permease protein
MSPYSHATFFDVIALFFQRFFRLLTGQLSFESLASDDIQILVLIAVASSGALVGALLILRKMTMLANALSHTILVGIVGVYVATSSGLFEHGGGINIQAMLTAAVAMGFVTAFLTHFLTHVVKLQEDASIGLVFTTLFALGVILVTVLTRSAHIGLEIVMGNVDALHVDDIKLVWVILLINAVLIFLFYKEYLITTFDPGLAKTLGFSALLFDYLLMTQTSITAVGGFRAVGVLMILAFITAPALTARLLTDNLKILLVFAVAAGCGSSIIGVAFSRHLLTVYDLPVSTSGVVVCVMIVLYGLAIVFSPGQGLISRFLSRRKLQEQIGLNK